MTPRVHASCVRSHVCHARRRVAGCSLAALVGSIIVAAASSPAHAQLTAQQLAGLKPKVTTILRQATAPSAEEKKVIEEYFTKSFFPALASDDPIQLGQLAKNRKDLFAQFINVKGSPDARNHLLNLTISNVGRMAVGNYHPAIRYNAVLIIGQLDKELAASASTAPTPLPAGTNALIALVENAEFNKVPVPSSVKVAALIGLDRHTRFGVDPQFAERITKAALAVATRTEAPDDVSPEVDDWMRRLAFRVLANQFAAGLTAPVSDAMANFLANKRVNIDDRCGVAELLKKEMFPAGQGVEPAPVAVALGSLAKETLAFEAKEAAAYNKAMLGDAGSTIGVGSRMSSPEMGFRGPEGGMGYGASPLADDGTKFKKRRMLDRVNVLRGAAVALANAGGSDEVKQRMTDLAAPLKTTFDIGVDPDEADLDVAKAVINASKEVSNLVSKWVPADEPAADDEEPFADAAEAAVEAPGADAAPAVEEAAPAEAPAAEAATPEAEAPVAEAPAN